MRIINSISSAHHGLKFPGGDNYDPQKLLIHKVQKIIDSEEISEQVYKSTRYGLREAAIEVAALKIKFGSLLKKGEAQYTDHKHPILLRIASIKKALDVYSPTQRSVGFKERVDKIIEFYNKQKD